MEAHRGVEGEPKESEHLVLARKRFLPYPCCWARPLRQRTKCTGISLHNCRQASPVNYIEGVQVANGAGHLSGVEPGPGLQEPVLPLQVEEELEGKEACEWVSRGLQLLECWSGDSWPRHPSELQCTQMTKACWPPPD